MGTETVALAPDTIPPRSDDAPYQVFFEASPIPTWIVDAETGRFLLVNDAAVRQYGYTREEFLAMSVDRIRLPEEAARRTQLLVAHSAAPFIATGTWHHRRKDGSVFEVHVAAQRITYEGRPALLTTMPDPEREAAVDALRLRERQLDEAQALAHVGSWDWDVATNQINRSAELCRIYGVPSGSSFGQDQFLARVHPDDRERVAALLADAIAQHRTHTDYECRIVRANGEIRYLHKHHVVSFDAAGQPVRLWGTSLDVTDRHVAEQALADSERHHRELVENASDIVTIVTAEGMVQYMSASVQRLLGYGTEELLGHSVFDFIHPDDAARVLESMQRDLAEPGTPNTVDFRFRHRDGTWRVLESIAQAHEQMPGVYTIVANSRDVTERTAAEERQQALMRELRAAQQTAQDATRAKSEFLANMSHEIRTPMNAVLGLTELLLETELTAEQRRHLEMVRDSGDVLLSLLNDILDLSKIEAEHLELEAIPLDLASLVHSTASLFAVAAREHEVELLVDVPSDVPRYVRGDPTRLRQILSNLIGNAVKFTPVGEIVVSATLGGVDNDHATVRLAVRDTGVGIPPDKIETVFKDFSQVDASTTRRYGGTGLGLSIARRLVRLMGGDITVASQLGRGTEFSFTLRLPMAPAPELRVAAAPVQFAGVRALVVDDNATNRRIVRGILAPVGATISEASTVANALAALERALADGLPYTVALLDSQMPDRDGWSLAAEIRRHPKLAGMHLLMLTSAGQRGDGEKCRELGIEGYLIKPVSRSDLVEAISTVLAGTAAPGAIVTRHALAEARVRLRILLAEDNAVNQEVATAMLRKRGHTVTIVDDGAKAVAAMTTGTFDVILMDVHMPEMDGLAATEAIRKLPSGALIPIIALTADALTGERERCLAAGMSGYLAKPFKSLELFAIVEGWGAPPEPPSAKALVGPALRPPPADIEGFRATMRQAGAQDSVDRILDTFILDAPKRSAALADALRTGRANDIQSTAHAYKSPAGSLGAHGLAALLNTIEIAGKEDRVEDARALATGVQDESDAVVAYVRTFRTEAPAHA